MFHASHLGDHVLSLIVETKLSPAEQTQEGQSYLYQREQHLFLFFCQGSDRGETFYDEHHVFKYSSIVKVDSGSYNYQLDYGFTIYERVEVNNSTQCDLLTLFDCQQISQADIVMDDLFRHDLQIFLNLIPLCLATIHQFEHILVKVCPPNFIQFWKGPYILYVLCHIDLGDEIFCFLITTELSEKIQQFSSYNADINKNMGRKVLFLCKLFSLDKFEESHVVHLSCVLELHYVLAFDSLDELGVMAWISLEVFDVAEDVCLELEDGMFLLMPGYFEDMGLEVRILCIFNEVVMIIVACKLFEGSLDVVASQKELLKFFLGILSQHQKIYLLDKCKRNDRQKFI